MRITQHANLPPHRCAVLPYIGNGNASGFFDSGSEIDRQRVYVSFEAVCEMARLLGWQGPRAVKSLEAEVVSKQARIDQLEAEVKEADKFAEAAEYTLSKFGQKVQRKPGRKPANVEA